MGDGSPGQAAVTSCRGAQTPGPRVRWAGAAAPTTPAGDPAFTSDPQVPVLSEAPPTSPGSPVSCPRCDADSICGCSSRRDSSLWPLIPFAFRPRRLHVARHAFLVLCARQSGSVGGQVTGSPRPPGQHASGRSPHAPSDTGTVSPPNCSYSCGRDCVSVCAHVCYDVILGISLHLHGN